ncbi:MAG: hypothetical protein K2P58_03285 [Hyphomonadaceae bacterium]|nr:hypothetical protein [Hyphomonadaceae bacterium]
MKRCLGAVLFMVAAACTPTPQHKAATPTLPPLDEPECTAQASRDWSAVGSQYYVIEAEARGGACAEALATVRIRSVQGAVLFTRDYRVSDVPLAFNPNNDETGLRADLDAWTLNTADPPTTDMLPAWPARGERPPGFRPAVARSVYEAARGAQGPLFCFPDGAESTACVAMAGDTATLLGSLTPEQP